MNQIAFGVKTRTGRITYAALPATKKQLREFIRERNHKVHYHGKHRIMYVEGSKALEVIHNAETAYPARNFQLRVYSPIREVHDLAGQGNLVAN